MADSFEADAIVVYQGASLHVVFDVTDEAGVALTLLANGYDRAAMQARARPSSGETLLDLSTTAGQISIEPAGATGQVHVDAGADVTLLVTRNGVYDCLAWKSANPDDVLVIAAGHIRLVKRVTRR